MTIDDRLNQHLERQADAIQLAPADPAEAMARGRRRRTHRRVTLTAIVAVAGLGVAALAVSPGGDDPAQVQGALSASVAPTSFDWTVVEAQAGLGYGRGTTVAAGSVYGLSTAPGTGDVAGTHLYRSDDGAEWAEVSLPAGLRTSSLAGTADTLYALGTAPAAGGGRDLVLASSKDGAASWSSAALPTEVQALEARHPGEILVSPPVVAARDASHVVVGVQVTAHPDVRDQIPGYDPELHSIEIRPEGVLVYQECTEDCDESVASPTTVAPDGAGEDPEVAARGLSDGGKEPTTYGWDELDVDPELVDLVAGRAYVYATQDGTTFEASELPAGLPGQTVQVVAAADGFRVLLGDYPSAEGSSPTTAVLTSADGRSFTPAGPAVPGSLGTSGLLGDRVALSTWNVDGTTSVYLEQGGAFVPLDLSQALEGDAFLGEVSFGPLGLAGIVWQNQGEVSTPAVIHSADGTTVSLVPIAGQSGVPSELRNVVGVSVTADGVFVRINDAPDGDPATAPTQRVLVGTPA